MIDDVLHNRYRIVDKLGYGGYSTIWLAHDKESECLVVIKVGISSTSQPQRECDTLRSLSIAAPKASYTTETFNTFKFEGPNGLHPCCILGPAKGNLKDASISKLFPIKIARALAAKAALSLAFVHSQGYVHGDIHLRNMLIKQPPSFSTQSVESFREEYGEPEMEPVTRNDNEPLSRAVPPQATLPVMLGKEARDFTLDDAQDLILSDFGEAFSPTIETRLGKNCNTPVASMAPEALFEPDTALGFPSDIWSLGLTIWDILGMKFLFSQESGDQNEIVLQQINVLGLENFPSRWRKAWERPAEEAGWDELIPCQASY